MNKLLLAGAALCTFAATAPTSAKYLDRIDAGIDNRISQLQTQLRKGVREGKIDRREARPLRAQLRELTLVEREYRDDGFSRQEQTELDRRMAAVDDQMRFADGGTRQDG